MTIENAFEPSIQPPEGEILRLVAQVVAAYVGRNAIAAAEVPALIQTVYSALAATSSSEPAPIAAPEAPKPAVPVKKSVTPDYIVCLEDGKKLKMLKRHLRSTYGLTPEDYRAKWGLPADYPMVAPNYAAQRSQFAKQIGLGKQTTVRRGGRRKKVTTP